MPFLEKKITLNFDKKPKSRFFNVLSFWISCISLVVTVGASCTATVYSCSIKHIAIFPTRQNSGPKKNQILKLRHQENTKLGYGVKHSCFCDVNLSKLSEFLRYFEPIKRKAPRIFNQILNIQSQTV